ncbi:Phosphatidate cytidylyltransferase [Nitrospira sp. KM1]|uniref:phosphatidate cytidylyltransferase n=1 Tax=Nitrospira sp. KM1 TaxID=1936990 RepID=UPI0013A78FE3|nr:phosphatidate cytidylyltransferase [Nitrospira sp. KM1]BCA56998.1 Phosphatidate cytidylyltransferase [Nitrospira sp. KM1]
MLEYGAANPEPIPVTTSTSRFDPRRVYTALILAPLVYVAIRYFPPLAFSAFVLALGSVALLEFYRLAPSLHHDRWFVAVGLLGFGALIVEPLRPGLLIHVVLGTVVVLLSLPIALRAALDDALKNAAVVLLGVFYLGSTLGFTVQTRLLPGGEWLIFFLLLVTWAADTGAYYAGTLFGRHRLAPRISPKKSVEGLMGGLLIAVVVAFLSRWWFLPGLSATHCAVLGILLTMAGLWGDLAESALKRSVGAKDSGGVLPGHGGMLDRLDSLLFTAPAFYYYVTLVAGPEAYS